MSSFYRINVSRHGIFYFRIDDEFKTFGSIQSLVRDLRARFPVSQGFEVNLTCWEVSSRPVEVE